MHNISWYQAEKWFDLVENEPKLNNEIRIFIIMSLLHDEWIGINKAFEICEKFKIFSKPCLVIQEDFSKFVQ